jgi:hypothetical protein
LSASPTPVAPAAAVSPATSQAAAFTLPGKKLSVLPIGLGVFAGISVIALIVVGLVTYERTKYRKVRSQFLLLSCVTNPQTWVSFSCLGNENLLKLDKQWVPGAWREFFAPNNSHLQS